MKTSSNIEVFTLMVCAVIFFVHVQGLAYEPDTDRPGMDYKNYELSIADWTFCKSSCDSDPKCKAWTYVKPTGGGKAHCWLKNGIPEKKPDKCCISGVKMSKIIKPLIKRTTKIEVTSPYEGAVCAINIICPIKWETGLIKNYNTVFLEIVYADGSPTAGAYPVTNKGEYKWIPDESFYDEGVYCEDFRVKVYTHDNKFKGNSGIFNVGKFLNIPCK